MSAEAVAIVGVGVALLAVLVPLLLTLAANLGRRIDALAADVAEVRRDLIARTDRLTDDLHSLGERVARMEGALAVPWRPANGSPAAPPAPSPEVSK